MKSVFVVLDSLDVGEYFTLYKTQEGAEKSIKENRYFDGGVLVELKPVKKFAKPAMPVVEEVEFDEEEDVWTDVMFADEEEEEQEEE